MSECKSKIISLTKDCGWNVMPKARYEFTETECFKNGSYFGRVIEFTDYRIKVEVDNGNKYMAGIIIEFEMESNE